MKYLSPQQVRQRLGIGAARLRQADMDARLAPVRVGRLRVYPESTVAAELNKRCDAARKDNR